MLPSAVNYKAAFGIDAGGAVERSCSRLSNVDEHSCLLVNVAIR
jgi:hypothetical protein